MTKPAKSRPVFTLLVQVGRKQGDGLPEGTTGAALLCYAAAVDEAEAVNETVAVLREAGMAPLEVEGVGSAEERMAEGQVILADEQALMDRALTDNAVIVAQTTLFDD
ncbi:MAG: hypothetical protein AAGH74_06830 [Pseudomonadota bacterium]